jgi:hypothetical protein
MTYEPTKTQMDAAYSAWASSPSPFSQPSAMGAALDAAGCMPAGMFRGEAIRLALAAYNAPGDGSVSPMRRALAAVGPPVPEPGTQYRIALQFSPSADYETWQTVAAPVFCTSAAEEDIYARIRDLITALPAASPPAASGQEGPR